LRAQAGGRFHPQSIILRERIAALLRKFARYLFRLESFKKPVFLFLLGLSPLSLHYFS